MLILKKELNTNYSFSDGLNLSLTKASRSTCHGRVTERTQTHLALQQSAQRQSFSKSHVPLLRTEPPSPSQSEAANQWNLKACLVLEGPFTLSSLRKLEHKRACNTALIPEGRGKILGLTEMGLWKHMAKASLTTWTAYLPQDCTVRNKLICS